MTDDAGAEPAATARGMADWPRDEAAVPRWIDAMVAAPELIQRPILLLDDARDGARYRRLAVGHSQHHRVERDGARRHGCRELGGERVGLLGRSQRGQAHVRGIVPVRLTSCESRRGVSRRRTYLHGRSATGVLDEPMADVARLLGAGPPVDEYGATVLATHPLRGTEPDPIAAVLPVLVEQHRVSQEAVDACTGPLAVDAAGKQDPLVGDA